MEFLRLWFTGYFSPVRFIERLRAKPALLYGGELQDLDPVPGHRGRRSPCGQGYDQIVKDPPPVPGRSKISIPSPGVGGAGRPTDRAAISL